jgi:(2Fe-2S) ferredoxin
MMQNDRKKMLVCTNYRANPSHPSCAASGSKAIIVQLNAALRAQSILIAVEEAPCLGLCQHGPNVRLIPSGEIFNHVTTDTLQLIVQASKDFLAK